MSLTIFRAEVGELRADVVGLGQVQLSVLGESPQPVSAGLATSAIEVHGKSNAVVGTGLLVPIADVPGEGQRSLETLQGLPMKSPAGVHDAEVAQSSRYAGAVADLDTDVKGSLMMKERPVVVSLALIGVAEAVPGPGFADAIAGPPGNGQGLLEVVKSLFVPALPLKDAAEVVQGAGFEGVVADLPADSERLLKESDGIFGHTALPMDKADVVQRPRLPGPVAAFTGDGQRLLELVGRLLIATPRLVDAAEVGQRGDLAGAVAGLTRCFEGVDLDGVGVGQVATGVEVAPKDGGELGSVPGPAAKRSDSEEIWPFAVQPGLRADRVGDGGSRGARRRRVWRAAGGGVEHFGGASGGGQVVVQEAVDRRVAVLVAVVADEMCGVDACQVVHLVPPVAVALLDQMTAGEGVEHLHGVLEGRAGERSHDVGVEVLAGVQPEQSERSGRVGRQVAIGP